MKRFSLMSLVMLSVVLLTSCEIVTGIFKAGVWSGVIMVVVVVALIIWLVAKLMGGGKE